MSGTIRNCLFEDVMPSISLGDVNTPDSTHKTVEIDNVLIKQAMYEYNGMKHFTPF